MKNMTQESIELLSEFIVEEMRHREKIKELRIKLDNPGFEFNHEALDFAKRAYIKTLGDDREVWSDLVKHQI